MIADLGLNHLERHVLRCGFTVQAIRSDYGYDYVMWTYSHSGEIESGFSYFQVKATDSVRFVKDGTMISWPIDRRDLRLWLKESYPVILVVYDGAKEQAYWLYLQAYFSRQSSRELFAAGESINVQIPTVNRINRSAIRRIARYKHEIELQLSGKVQHHD